MDFNTVAFSSIYMDLESDWDQRMDILKAELNGRRPLEKHHTEVLLAISNNAMDFEVLTCPEAVFFLQIALPRTFHYERKMSPSPFLQLYTKLREPTLVEWLKMLFNYLGRAHNIFGYVLRVNFRNCGFDERELGGALIEAFKSDGYQLAIQSTLGHFFDNPWIRSLARCHEDRLYKITGKLESPEEVGYLVRQFLLFILRGGKKTDCKCAWLPLQQGCTCVLDLENDWIIEYFGCLTSLVIQRRTGYFDRLEPPGSGPTFNEWSKPMENEFMQAAASQILSLETYKIVRRTMDLKEDVEMEKFKPRKLTATEAQGNFQGVGTLHKGCQHEACQQAKKGDCSNVSCKTHCARDGYLKCHPHRYDGFGGEPKYTPKIPFKLPELVAMSAKKEN